MIRAGVGEQELSDEIRDLAADMLGVTRHWHRRDCAGRSTTRCNLFWSTRRTG